MNNAHSIVVYRNPLEQYLWESGLAVGIILGMVAAFVAVVSMDWLIKQYRRRYAKSRLYTSNDDKIVISTGILAAVATIYWFMG